MDFMKVGNTFHDGMLENSVNGLKMKKLTEDIKKTGDATTDEELMKACKTFESYMLEQMLEKMEKMAHIFDEEEKDNEYVSMFRENFIKDQAEMMTEHTDLGIAKMLYESMKRNVLAKDISPKKEMNE